MPKTKPWYPTYYYSYAGQSARFRTFGPMADMTIEQLDELQAALTDEFELREKWRTLATSSDISGKE